MPTGKSHIVNVLGMDPSLSNWGLAYGTYNLKTAKLAIKTIQVIQTKKAARTPLVSTDDLNRAVQLANHAFAVMRSAHVTFVEVPTGSRSARAMTSYGIAIGILASARVNNCPFIPVTPTALKLATVGSETASKAQMIDWAIDQYPHLDWPVTHTKNGSSIALKAEHMADAIGAIKAGLLTNDFQQLLALNRSA